MAVPTWKFVLANSGDFSNLGELSQARDRSLEVTLNKAGAASFSVPLDDPLGRQIYPLTHCVKCYRLGSDNVNRLIWSGMVWDVTEDLVAGKMQVGCVGWLQMLAKRLLRRQKQYSATNNAGGPWTDAQIMYDLLADANATNITWDAGFPSGYTVPLMPGASTPTLMTQGTASGDFSTKNRVLTIEKGAQILGEIQRLTDIENGSDIQVDPATRALNIYAKKLTDRPQAQFGYGWGTDNLKQLTRQLDPSTLVNFIYVTGSSPSVAPATADTKLNPAPTQNPPKLGEDSMQTYSLWEEQAGISDAVNAEILLTYAGAEILVRSSPRIVYTMVPEPFVTGAKGRIPEPFVDYTVGDQVYFSARYGQRVTISKQAVRVFGLSLQIDAEGNEQIQTLNTSPS
jgi:hypothetical protein